MQHLALQLSTWTLKSFLALLAVALAELLLHRRSLATGSHQLLHLRSALQHPRTLEGSHLDLPSSPSVDLEEQGLPTPASPLQEEVAVTKDSVSLRLQMSLVLEKMTVCLSGPHLRA